MSKDYVYYGKAILNALQADTALCKLLEENNQQYPHLMNRWNDIYASVMCRYCNI